MLPELLLVFGVLESSVKVMTSVLRLVLLPSLTLGEIFFELLDIVPADLTRVDTTDNGQVPHALQFFGLLPFLDQSDIEIDNTEGTLHVHASEHTVSSSEESIQDALSVDTLRLLEWFDVVLVHEFVDRLVVIRLLEPFFPNFEGVQWSTAPKDSVER